MKLKHQTRRDLETVGGMRPGIWNVDLKLRINLFGKRKISDEKRDVRLDGTDFGTHFYS